MTTYKSSAASLFSCAARQSAVVQVCGWCGEPSAEPMRTVESYEIPRDHFGCARDARQAARAFCVCFEFAGDNSGCPVHGGR
jgi:hypothetical protein